MFDPGLHWYELGIHTSFAFMIIIFLAGGIYEWSKFFYCVANNIVPKDANGQTYDFSDIMKCTFAGTIFGVVLIGLIACVWPVGVPVILLCVGNEIAKAIGKKRKEQKLDLKKGR